MSATAPRGYQHTIPVTPEGHQRLSEELRSLVAEREALASRLREARADGDPPAENAGLLDALDDHVRLEYRIATLQSDLARARVIDGLARSDEAAVGTRVRLRPLDRDEATLDYTLVSSLEADPTLGRLSVESPVGEACVGRRPGEIVAVHAPVGRLSFELVAVARAGGGDHTSDRGVRRELSAAPAALAA
jgi:transcription elongation factor GreA